MTAPELISIIMVSHQTGPVLEQAIASVLAQQGSFEFILVNNGNPPEIEEDLVERFKDSPNVRLMTGHGDIGLVQGRNLGARVASGDHLLFVEDNCIFPDDVLTFLGLEAQNIEKSFILAACLVDEAGQEKESSRLRLLTPLVAFINKLQLSSFFPAYQTSLTKTPLPTKAIPVPAVGSAFMFCAKRDFVSLKGFNEKYFMDLSVMDFCFNFNNKGGVVYFLPKLVVRQVEKTGASFAGREGDKSAASYRHYFFENFSDVYPQPILWVLSLLYWVRLGLRTAAQSRSGV